MGTAKTPWILDRRGDVSYTFPIFGEDPADRPDLDRNKRGNVMRATSWAVGIVMLAMVAAGCGTTHQQSADDREYSPPTSIYNILDSTALVYSDPAAGSPVNDNPYRWLGFILHPIGQVVDYGINRPLYTLASWFPYMTGYTAEDNMLDAQRR